MSKLPNYEVIAIAKLLKEFDKELLLELSSNLFSGVYKKIFENISAYFLEHTKLPTLEVFQAYVLPKAPPQAKPIIIGILQNVKSVDVALVDRAEITRGLRDKQLIDSLDDSMSSLVTMTANRDVEGVRSLLNTLASDLNTAGVQPKDLSSAILEPDRSRIIPTYIDGLDESIVGVAGLTIVAGASGGGKTIMLLNMAINQYLNGHNILFISLELSAQNLGHRLAAYLTKISFTRIIKNETTKEEKRQIQEALDDFFSRPNKFRVVAEPIDSEELLALINIEKALNNIDVVYLDYMNLVLMRNSSSTWAGLVDLARELHRISMNLGIPTVSAAQADLESKPKGDQYPVIRTRGSKELEYSSTLMLYLYPPEEAPDALVCYVLKNRNNSKCRIIADKNFEHMEISPVMTLT